MVSGGLQNVSSPTESGLRKNANDFEFASSDERGFTSPMRLGLSCLFLLCLTSSFAYVVGRGQRMTAETGHCCLASEGYVFWNAARATVNGEDPYSDEITRENNIFYYGSLDNARKYEPQRFAYPLFAVLPAVPFGWLSFQGASRILILLFAVLAGVWAGWLRGLWNTRTLLYTGFIFASYPVFYDVVSLQPTLLFLAAAIAGLALLRCHHELLAAALLAFAMSKPQIVAPILLPFVVEAIESEQYRRFVALVIAAEATLVLLAATLQRRWIAEWISATRDYATYSPKPMAYGWFGPAAPVISAFVFLALLAILWLCRRSDPLFRVGLSVVALYSLLPYRSYNAAVFIIPIIWLADNADRVRAGGALHELALGFTRVAVVALWVMTAVGAALLWSSLWKIGFMLPVLALHILFFSLCAVMFLQCGSELKATPAPGAPQE